VTRGQFAALVAASLAACGTERIHDDACPSCPSGSIHGAGVLDPASTEFHGKELRDRDWDFALCATCHGDDFTGGKAQASCTTCHVRGPTACDTCHQEVPTTGAHTAHVGTGSAALTCAACHEVPARWDADGHVRRGGHADPPPAEVVMGGLAAVTVDAVDRAGPPVYDAGTCSNVYCHGDLLGHAGGTARQPAWSVHPPGAAPCDNCHGAPPPSHAGSACATCHPSGSVHLDGILQIGHDTSGCSGCHGGATSPAPPRDLAGNQLTTAIGVGAHQAHLQAPSQLSVPVPCSACHQVPTDTTSLGHIDSLGPAEVVADLGWDRTLGTCATAWCHGAARPQWTVAAGAACGTCHAVPPTRAPHTPDMTLPACAACHPATMNPSGQFIIGGAHLNGVTNAP
jgi:predicted CxxxxCH...CXXCH cytochrome family protein